MPCLYGGNGFEELRNCQTHWLVHFKWVQFILRLNYPSVRKSMRKRGSLGLLGVHTRTLLLTSPRACSVSCPRLSSTPCPPPRSSYLPEEQLCLTGSHRYAKPFCLCSPGCQPVYIYQYSGPHTLFPELPAGLDPLHLSVGCLALLPVLPAAPPAWLHRPHPLVQAQDGQGPPSCPLSGET